VVSAAASGGTLLPVAKWIVTVVAVWNFGGVVADAVIPFTARQHLWNPRWPPHAKFHNCQTMVMGLLLGGISLWLLFGMGPLTPRRLVLAAAVAGTYFVSMLFAPLFPGTAWHDPEFAALDPMPLGISSQKVLAIVLSALLAIAVLLALRS
jgi:hypothetical protein